MAKKVFIGAKKIGGQSVSRSCQMGAAHLRLKYASKLGARLRDETVKGFGRKHEEVDTSPSQEYIPSPAAAFDHEEIAILREIGFAGKPQSLDWARLR